MISVDSFNSELKKKVRSYVKEDIKVLQVTPIKVIVKLRFHSGDIYSASVAVAMVCAAAPCRLTSHSIKGNYGSISEGAFIDLVFEQT